MAPHAEAKPRLLSRLPCAHLWLCVCDGTAQAPGRPVATGRSLDDADYEDERPSVLVFMDVDWKSTQGIAVLDAGSREQEESVIAQAAKALAEGFAEGLGVTQGFEPAAVAGPRHACVGEGDASLLSKSHNRGSIFDDARGETNVTKPALMTSPAGILARRHLGGMASTSSSGRQAFADFCLEDLLDGFGGFVDDSEADRFTGFVEVGTLDDDLCQRYISASPGASRLEHVGERWQEDPSPCNDRVILGIEPSEPGEHQSREEQYCSEGACLAMHDKVGMPVDDKRGGLTC